MKEKKKKLAFYGIKFFPSRGGTSRVAENLIRQLKDDYNITIYCYKHPLASTNVYGINVIQIPEIKMGSFGVLLYYFICFIHIRFLSKYDIIHAHKIDSFTFLHGFSRNTKVIATAHEAPYMRDKWSSLAKKFFKFNEQLFLSFKGVKTAISKPLADFYDKEYSKKIIYIPNGINPDEGIEKKSLDKFWPSTVSKNDPFILFAARRIMGTKGLHTMLKAYNEMNFKGNIFIAGDCNDFPDYIKKVKQENQKLSLHFLGFVNSLSVLLHLVEKCEYFVFPSETEGMSIMLLEVASIGKPIIASDIPENTNVFTEEELLFFKNKSVDDLKKKIIWAMENRSLFAKKGEYAKKKVLLEYNWKEISAHYKALYNKNND